VANKLAKEAAAEEEEVEEAKDDNFKWYKLKWMNV
jgi:hypothetical protein